MRTEHDLRATMEDLAATAPTGAEILSRFQAPPRRARHRVLVPAVAVAATIMVIAVIASVVHARQGDQSAASANGSTRPSVAHPCAAGGQLDITGITMRPVDGLAATTRSETSCSGYSDRELDNSRGIGVGSVYLYRAGVFDTRLLEHATKVSGSGVDGYVLTLNPSNPRVAHMLDPQNNLTAAKTRLMCPVTLTAGTRTPTAVSTSAGPSGSTCPAMAAVGWAYAPNSWALVAASTLDYASSFYGHDRTAKLLQIAAATDTAHPALITVPFQNHSLPAGVRMTSVYSYTTAAGRVIASTVGFGVTGRPGCPAGLVCDQVGEVSLTPRSTKPTLSGTPVAVNGRTGYLLDQGEYRPDIELSLWTGAWLVTVGQASDRAVPDRTLIQIARSLRYAVSVTDRSTWFDVNAAFDH